MTCAFVLVRWWPWAAGGAVVLIGAAFAVWWALSTASEERRGGTLDLTGVRGIGMAGDPDDWFATPFGSPPIVELETGRVVDPGEPPRIELRRCRPDRGVHYHGDGDRCECGQTSNVYSAPGLGFHPFAGRRGGDEAA